MVFCFVGFVFVFFLRLRANGRNGERKIEELLKVSVSAVATSPFLLVFQSLAPFRVAELSSPCVCVPAWNCISSTLWQGKHYRSHHKVLTCRAASLYIIFLIHETCI